MIYVSTDYGNFSGKNYSDRTLSLKNNGSVRLLITDSVWLKIVVDSSAYNSYIFFLGVSAVAVCPVCNSFTEVKRDCPNCGRQMVDAGKIQDFYDGYSPYLAQDIYQDGYACNDSVHCVHLFSCPCCHYDHRLAFRKEEARQPVD